MKGESKGRPEKRNRRDHINAVFMAIISKVKEIEKANY